MASALRPRTGTLFLYSIVQEGGGSRGGVRYCKNSEQRCFVLALCSLVFAVKGPDELVHASALTLGLAAIARPPYT